MKRLLVIVLLAVTSLSAYAQEGMVTGKVTDLSGEPVIGAAVFYDGLTNVNATTDFQGRYSITTWVRN